ncbi:MAG: hypothetical protein L6R37_001077 [Teloschistes peruensis]|nr:MAG: hypothetical protein L6R37_001077 [Teloschistes peruensis]
MAGHGRGLPDNSRSQSFLPTDLSRTLDIPSSPQEPVRPRIVEESQPQPSRSNPNHWFYRMMAYWDSLSNATPTSTTLDTPSSSQGAVLPPTAEKNQSQPSNSSSVPAETSTPFHSQFEEIAICKTLNVMGNDSAAQLLEEGLLQLPLRQLVDIANIWNLAARDANSDQEVEEAMEKHIYYRWLIYMKLLHEREMHSERR